MKYHKIVEQMELESIHITVLHTCKVVQKDDSKNKSMHIIQ